MDRPEDIAQEYFEPEPEDEAGWSMLDEPPIKTEVTEELEIKVVDREPQEAIIQEDFDDEEGDISVLGQTCPKTRKISPAPKEFVNKINKNVSIIEKIKKFKLITQEFTIENRMLTPTLKLKRKEIFKNYKQEIENLYLN